MKDLALHKANFVGAEPVLGVTRSYPSLQRLEVTTMLPNLHNVPSQDARLRDTQYDFALQQLQDLCVLPVSFRSPADNALVCKL